jgi:hypothetical protein
MPIAEEQLESWSHQGSVTQSAATYETIRKVLDDSKSPYYPKSYHIFLQGSYGNDTNVYKDSDVDIVLRLNDTYYSDLDNLNEAAKANYEKHREPASYGYDEFKADVLAWLQKNYGANVNPGKKAIFIKGNGARRDADVLPCARLRRWWASSNGVDGNYADGICFFLPNGTRVENFPKQHAENCTAKHKETDEWFKPVVRMYKNMRNRMIEEGVLKDGIAPSYFIEGLLWNVPKDKFGGSYEDSFVNTFNWILKAETTKLVVANQMYFLVRDNANECWPIANFNTYIAAAKKYWTDWQ